MAAEDDDLILDDNDSDLDGKVIPKDDRIVPPTIDLGAEPKEKVAPYVWARAHHNLPGFEQPSVDGARPKGLSIGEEGWIPNNEEGVSAVEQGFAELVSVPASPPPMPGRAKHR